MIESETTALTVAPVIEDAPDPEPAPAETPDAPEQGSEPRRRVGRPANGKKRDKDKYRQVTAYVSKDHHGQVKMALLADSVGQGKQKEFSELVDELLGRWLRVRADTKR